MIIFADIFIIDVRATPGLVARSMSKRRFRYLPGDAADTAHITFSSMRMNGFITVRAHCSAVRHLILVRR